MGWYIVVKVIKGNRYRYRQRTWRENGAVRTENVYLGREDGRGRRKTSVGAKGTAKPKTRSVNAADRVAGLEDASRALYAHAGSGLLAGEELPPKPSPDDFLDFGEEGTPFADRLASWQERVDALAGQSKIGKAFELVRAELEVSEAGYRFIGDDAHQHGGMGIHGEPSTFPAWVPDRLRRNKLFDRLLQALDAENVSYPARRSASRQRLLYQLILDRVDYLAGVDTAAIREKIMHTYGQSESDDV